ncbi:MAG: ABC transporter permease subunit, partial [Anaerolineales bacterium]|nr:ABC transporter permease subunit [Anaerolineales bacterium]
PIPRWQIVTVKTVALGIALLIILAIVGAGAALTMEMITISVETRVTSLDVFLSLLAAWPLAMAVGMISLFLGAFSPNRRTASAIATVVVLVSYLGSNLTGLIASLENIEHFFLFHYYEATAEALEVGQQTGNTAALLAIALVAFALTLIFFQRRNITVGAWPWQRGVINR